MKERIRLPLDPGFDPVRDYEGRSESIYYMSMWLNGQLDKHPRFKHDQIKKQKVWTAITQLVMNKYSTIWVDFAQAWNSGAIEKGAMSFPGVTDSDDIFDFLELILRTWQELYRAIDQGELVLMDSTQQVPANTTLN